MIKHGKEKKRYVLWYSVAFAVMFFFCCAIYFIIYKKAFMWREDSIKEHYQGYLYIGKLLRTWLRNIIREHKFAFPLWDMAIGYGSDVPTTLSSYLNDPFYWFSVFFPGKSSEIGYTIMVIAKFYLTGLSFTLFVRHKGCELYASIAGALVYIFSMSAYIGFYHPGFLNPLYILPVLIIGVDRLFEENRPVLYVAALSFLLINSLYFTYEIAVIVMGYCVIKLSFSPKEVKTARNSVRLVLRFVVYSLLSAGIVAVSFLHNAFALMNMDRLDLQHYVPVLYSKGINAGIFVGWLSGFNMQGRDSFIGFGALALVCLMALFILGKRHRQLKLEAALMTICLFIPFVGHVMNGFSYTANRWVYGYCMLIAYVVAVTLPEIKSLTVWQSTLVAFFSIVYIVVARGVFNASGQSFETISCLVVFIAFLCFVFPKLETWQYRLLTVALSCISVAIFSLFFFDMNYTNILGDFVDADMPYSLSSTSSGNPLVAEIKKSDSERYDRYNVSNVTNAGWVYGMGNFDFYDSMYNSSIDQFHNKMALLTAPWVHSYSGLNRRSELEALMGTNHFIVYADDEAERAYGYDSLEYEKKVGKKLVQSYAMSRNNSLFYLFDKSVSYEDYEALEPLERQQLLMQAVVSDAPNASIEEIQIDDDTLDYEIEDKQSLASNEKKIKVKSDGATMTLTFEPVAMSEFYVLLKDFYYHQVGRVIWNTEADYVVNINAFYEGMPVENRQISVRGNNNQSHLYGGKHNWLLNLGYSEDPIDKIVLTFFGVGSFDMGGIKLFARPQEELEASLGRLPEGEDGFVFDVNRIYGKLELDRDQYLFTSVPYSTGWVAYVDGERVEILKADTAFMAIPLKAGTHEVEFRYVTPALKLGGAVSCVSWLGLAIFWICRRRVARHRN